MRVAGATTFTIATTVTSRISEILHNAVAPRHFERCPAGRDYAEGEQGLGQREIADRSFDDIGGVEFVFSDISFLVFLIQNRQEVCRILAFHHRPLRVPREE